MDRRTVDRAAVAGCSGDPVKLADLLDEAVRRATALTGGIVPAQPAERALVLELLAFPAVVSQVAQTLEFHRLAGHLYQRVLRQGLGLLGIVSPERM